MFILDWLKIGVSWILVQFHGLFTNVFGMPTDSGWTWTFSIVGLVVVIRILLIPLFVKQIKSQRNLQLIQPQLKEIQKKYAGDKDRQSQEMMKLYRETGTNPLASCLPILLQAPIFFALFGVLQSIAQWSTDPSYHAQGVFAWPQYADLVEQAHNAQVMGVPLYGTFVHADQTPNPTATRVVALIMIALMTITSFTTQRQLIVKNSAPDNPMVKQQKILLYVFPLIFAVSGINFPIGVLIYWFTTNLWSMGQQFWVIRNNPQPGTPAAAAKEARLRAKQAATDKAIVSAMETTEDVADATSETTSRVQPKRTSRSQRKKK